MNNQFRKKIFIIGLIYGQVFLNFPKSYAISHVTDKPVASQEFPKEKATNLPNAVKTPSKHIAKRKGLSALKKEQGQELLRSSGKLLLGVGIVGGAGYLISGPSAFSAAAFIGPLLSSVMVKPLENIGNKLCNLFTPGLADPALRKAMEYKKQYQNRKSKLTKSMREFLHKHISQYVNLVEKFGYEEKKIENAIEEIMLFPLSPKPINPDIAPIAQLMQNYPKEVRMAFGDFIADIIVNSKNAKLQKKTFPIMLVGPPGTGKTHLINQLKDLLGIDVQIIDITKYNYINGNSFWSGSSDKGIIVDALIGDAKKNNFSNKILVIDEIDKALAKDDKGAFLHPSAPAVISLLHTLLETQETTVRLSRYNNASYDIAHFNIVLIGNGTFTETLGKEMAAALETRINLIKFTGFQEEQKLAIAQEHIKQMCLNKGIDVTKIDQQVIKDIVKIDQEQGNQGVRSLIKVIDQYLRILEQSNLIGQIAGVSEVTFNAKIAFERAKQA